MIDDKKTIEEFSSLTKTMTEGFKSLVVASKEITQDDIEMAKNTKAVQDSRKEQMTIRQQLINNGADAAEANAQTRNETAKVLREQKEAIIKNNPVLTILIQ